MSNSEKSISDHFGESIAINTNDLTIDTAEVILDSFMDDNILKELPLLRYAINIYKIVDDVRGRFYLRKLEVFINSFNSNLTTQDEVVKNRERFESRNRDKELAYISIIVEKYLDFDKPALLGKLYLSYLDKIITWDDFCSFSEILDKLLGKDFIFFTTQKTYVTRRNEIPDELLRLTGVGLMYDYQNDSPFETTDGGLQMNSVFFQRVEAKERVYSRTSFGQLLVDALEYNMLQL